MSKSKVKGAVANALRNAGFESRDGKVFHAGTGMTISTRVVGDGNALPPGTQQSFGFDTTHGFLGEELLLWLWWRWETEGGEFTLPGGRIVGIAIDDLLVFAPTGGDETTQTLKDGLPTRTAEARTALRQGHRVGKARLLIAEGARQWSCTLDGERMALGAVRLPDDAEECESAIDRTADRAANWLALHEIVEALFAQFLKARTAAGWLKQEGAAIAVWMQS